MRIGLFVAMLSIAWSCGEKSGTTSEITYDDINVDSAEVETHLAELSRDEYQGRMPGTQGGRMTTAYLVSQLKESGVAPGFGDAFLQPVPLVEIDGELQGDLRIEVKDGKMLNFKAKEDFVAVTERPVDTVGIASSPLVFCGYGIVAPEYDWNDYSGVDLAGKTAIVLVNDPGLGAESDSIFKGNTMTYYGRWTYKYEEADRQGLAGILIIHETRMAGYPWFVVKTGWSGPQLHIDEGVNSDDCGIKGWLHLEKAKELFSQAGFDLSDMIKSARQPGFKPVDLNANATVALENKLKYDTSYNVIGMLEGKTSPEEHVVYTAHWDHLGIGAQVDGDSIYNGALDNASGTASLLGIASTMASGTRNARTAVFCFVTAEEQGLLGSEWYVNNPVLPLESTVANINMDAANIIGSARDLTITGFGQSDMDEWAEKHAKRQDRYVQGEQEPEKGYFFRSDHFNFAKKGVPALYAKGGYDHRKEGKEYAKKFRENYVTQHYHQPSDEYKASEWNLTGCIEDADLMLDIGLDLLNSKEWPEWKEGSEFKSIERPSKDNME